MKYSSYLSLLFILGFVLTSGNSYACGKKSAQVENTCFKEKSAADKKSCCKKTDSEDHTTNHSCDGSCKDLSCQDFSTSIGILIPSFSLLNTKDFHGEKVKFFDAATQVAVGFYSLFVRPKIG